MSDSFNNNVVIAVDFQKKCRLDPVSEDLVSNNDDFSPLFEPDNTADDEVGQVVQSAVNMAIDAFKNHSGAAFDGRYFVPMQNVTHQNAAAKVWFELKKLAEVEGFTVNLLKADNRLADGLGHWVTKHHFLLEFIPKQKALPPSERLKRIADMRDENLPTNLNHLP